MGIVTFILQQSYTLSGMRQRVTAPTTMVFYQAAGRVAGHTLLREAVGVEVVRWEERLTTVAAERTLVDSNLSRAPPPGP